jgi:hypothetical protein
MVTRERDRTIDPNIRICRSRLQLSSPSFIFSADGLINTTVHRNSQLRLHAAVRLEASARRDARRMPKTALRRKTGRANEPLPVRSDTGLAQGLHCITVYFVENQMAFRVTCHFHLQGRKRSEARNLREAALQAEVPSAPEDCVIFGEMLSYGEVVA